MSIQDDIARLEAAKQLICLESRLTGEDTVRTLFVSCEVFDAVTPPHKGEQIHRCAEFREFLDGFLEGGHFTVAEDPDLKPSHAQIARVHPVGATFWDFRVTAPTPGIRALGAFAAHDTFVVLTWEYREHIPDFNAEVTRCQHEWAYLFGATLPFKGRHLDDYLSNYTAV